MQNLNVFNGTIEICVYANQITNRLEYVTRFIFETVLRCKLEFLDEIQIQNTTFLKSNLVINYSDRYLENTFQILPHGVLGMSEGFEFRLIKSNTAYGSIVMGSEIKTADLFSAIFYFISRAEEWQNRFRDKHDRFCADSVLGDEFDFNNPYVDEWIETLRNQLHTYNPSFKIPKPEFKCVYTFDIDNGFAFTGKPFWKLLLGLMRDLIMFNINFVKKRSSVLLGRSKDPFDQYEELLNHIKSHKLQTVFFFLVNRKVKQDRGANLNSKIFVNLFNRFRQSAIRCALHPSYTTYNKSSGIMQERVKLEAFTGTSIQTSRQHFLKFNIRQTPKCLMDAGILEDWTMGFSDTLGHRARTTHVFSYYNFITEQVEPLKFYPFCVMDGVFYIHQGVSMQKAIESTLSFKHRIQNLGGNFVMVFHERIFSELHHPGYSKFFYKITETEPQV